MYSTLNTLLATSARLIFNAMATSMALLLAAPSYASELEQIAASNLAVSPPVTVTLLSNKNGSVRYKGIANFDNAGMGSQSMLYPAPNAAGLLAAVITHGIIIGSAKERQKKQLQDDADSALQPYREVINGFDTADLLDRAFRVTTFQFPKKITHETTSEAGTLLIDADPQFFLTPDQSALIVENLVAARPTTPSPLSEYRGTIRVISSPRTEDDLVTFWTENNGENLKRESAKILAASLDLAVTISSSKEFSASGPQRTIRYAEGRSDHIERGEILSESCDRIVLRTLRGLLLVVPGRCNK